MLVGDHVVCVEVGFIQRRVNIEQRRKMVMVGPNIY